MVDKELIPINWEKNNSIITVIGVGGGGSNAVTHMYKTGIKDVNFVVCNTDKQALNNSVVPNKIYLGEKMTQGLGAGCDPEVGRKAAVESIEEIKSFLEGETRMVFITCGMGGGTGTGAAPVIAKEAKSRGLLTIGVITLPFTHEGIGNRRRATAGINEMQKHVDSLIVVDNNKIYDVFGTKNYFDALPQADEVLCTAVKGIADIINSSAHRNVDFADVYNRMRGSGIAIIGMGSANMDSGAGRAGDAVKRAFDMPLLGDIDFQTGKNIIANIRASNIEGIGMTTEEHQQIVSYIQDLTGNAENFKVAEINDPSMEDTIKVTIIATGFDNTCLPEEFIMDDKDKVILDDDENIYRIGAPITYPPLTNAVSEYRPISKNGKPSLILGPDESEHKYDDEPAYIRRDNLLSKLKENE